jgi:hypothetical protein
MFEEQENPEQPDSAEPDDAEGISEQVPEEVSGEGDTPLGTSGEHSDAPGPHGTGPIYEDEAEED